MKTARRKGAIGITALLSAGPVLTLSSQTAWQNTIELLRGRNSR